MNSSALRRKPLALLALVALAACGTAWAQAQSQVPVATNLADTTWRASLEGKALADALRNGGYTLFFRHTVTDFDQQDKRLDGSGPCAEQRNLTQKGRDDAQALGKAIAKARIPVDEVLASPFCRTRESAQLMFGRAIVTDDVRGGPKELGADINDKLIAILRTPPARGTNRAIVGHTNAFFTISNLAHLDDGEAAVFAVRDGKLVVVARIKAADWAKLP